MPDLSPELLALGFIWYVAFLFSTTCHEAAHALAATRCPDFASSVLGAFFSLNLLLGTFNLLPVPPLDGSTAIMLFMGETRSQRYLDWLRGNSYAMVGLLLGILAFRYIYGPIKAIATYYLLH